MYGDSVPRVLVVDEALLVAPEQIERVATAIAKHARSAPYRVFVPKRAGLTQDVGARAEVLAHLADDARLGASLPRFDDAELVAVAVLEHLNRQGLAASLQLEDAPRVYPQSGITPIEAGFDETLRRARQWALDHGATHVEILALSKKHPDLRHHPAPYPLVRFLDEEENIVVPR